MASTGSHRLRTLAIVIVVLVALVVAADRVTLVIAEKTAADNIKSSQNLPSTPDVDVSGFPFLTQLASGSYDKITVTAKNVPVAQTSPELDLASVEVVLDGVDANRDFSRVHTRTATATASVTYAELSSTLGVTVSYAGKGTIRTSKTVAGQTLSIDTTPRLANGALSFTSSTVNGAASVAQSVVDSLTKVFDLNVPLDGIPFKLRVRTLKVTETGLTLSLDGSDLTYTKS